MIKILYADENIYNYLETNDNTFAVDSRTGELKEAVTITVPVGTQIITPADRDIINQKKVSQRRKTNCARISKNIGNFYFAIARKPFCDISPATLGRLIFLATYLEFGSNRLVFDKDKTPIRRKDLPDLLALSNPAITAMLKEASPTFINKSSNGNIEMNSDYFCYGILSKSARNDPHQKIYRSFIRRLYKEDVSNTRYLGYIFKLLPYINIEYNIICKNPFEKDIDAIQPIYLSEFASIIGYNKSQISRLKKIYNKVRFNVGTEKQRFISFIGNGLDDDSVICINPRILYSGTDIDKVMILTKGFS